MSMACHFVCDFFSYKSHNSCVLLMSRHAKHKYLTINISSLIDGVTFLFVDTLKRNTK